MLITGRGVWEAFKGESGKHVVQRVPPTENRGRRHTSVISIAVLPFDEGLPESLDLKDVDITTARGSGPGGQHRNTTDSCVRAVHKPTGLSVVIDSRQQGQNKTLALQILSQRLQDRQIQAQKQETDIRRKEQLGAGSRSGSAFT